MIAGQNELEVNYNMYIFYVSVLRLKNDIQEVVFLLKLTISMKNLVLKTKSPLTFY